MATEAAVNDSAPKKDYILEEDERLQTIFSMTTEDVAEWIKKMGFPFYQDCFRRNFINGRKLILADASSLCKFGITDYNHIKFIAKEIRTLLKIDDPSWEAPKGIKVAYLELKSRSGKDVDNLTLKQFIQSQPQFLKYDSKYRASDEKNT